MNHQEIESLIRQVVKQALEEKSINTEKVKSNGNISISKENKNEFNIEISDITEIDLQEALYVENPVNRKAYMEMKHTTPARIGVGRAGARQNTKTLLRFRADHAAAMDAVFNDVNEDLIKELNLVSVCTCAETKEQYLANPAMGRIFNEENKNLLKENCDVNKQIQIIVTDGLSSTAIERNIRDLLPALIQGIKFFGLSVGKPIFVKHGRVGAMDSVTEILYPEVTILLVGERPGLVTGESLSCYMTYKGYVGISESARTVVSNIYKKGTHPSEAGAHIAEITKLMIDKKASGIDLKL